VIAVDAISFSFGEEKVLSQISFQVDRAEIVAILGPSGVGKTTLLRCIAGLLRPQTGKIRIDGSAPGMAASEQKVGYLFQQDSLLEWRNVRENVMLPFQAAKAKLPSAAVDERLTKSLQLVGLTGSAAKFPCELSGGMRQRAALARALAPDPSILLLDEPFAAIDLLTREKIMIELHAILRQAKTPTIFVTHHIEEAVFLSDRILLLGGKPAAIVDTFGDEMGRDRTEARLSEPAFLEIVRKLKQKLRTSIAGERQ
jgi:NitT/TauT family transport system ATP-binding protein